MVGEYFRKIHGDGCFRETEWIRMGRASRGKTS